MLNAAHEERERIRQEKRIESASQNPVRRSLASGLSILDPRLESPLGRLAFKGTISQREYDAGCEWREIFLNYLASIGAPNPFPGAVPLDPIDSLVVGPLEMPSDEVCEMWTRRFKEGKCILMECGGRVYHSVNSIAVYEEPDALGNSEFTIRAAIIGLKALADKL